jgi:hypothetical protein
MPGKKIILYFNLIIRAMNTSLCKLFLCLLTFFTLTSCKKESIQLEEVSPDKKITVSIKGEKASSMDPFEVNINTKGYGFNETITTEIFSGTIDSNNLKFKWINKNECYMVFMQQDNTIRRMHLKVNEDGILLNEEGSTSVDQ